MKKKEFRIHFDMPIRGSDIVVPMTAMAELHHSDPYYLLRSIEISFKRDDTSKGGVLMKELRIKHVKGEKEDIWVHCDTGRESDISRHAGLAIEASGNHTEE
ncbi:MAG: hypothetical protein ACTHMC_26355 [Pseudobacter sp.]|uniref:hypothetical protein n=1 Tax=Pseudobacter sp. TaxID=2045420 RepID=UPI003F7CFB61